MHVIYLVIVLYTQPRHTYEVVRVPPGVTMQECKKHAKKADKLLHEKYPNIPGGANCFEILIRDGIKF